MMALLSQLAAVVRSIPREIARRWVGKAILLNRQLAELTANGAAKTTLARVILFDLACCELVAVGLGGLTSTEFWWHVSVGTLPGGDG